MLLHKRGTKRNGHSPTLVIVALVIVAAVYALGSYAYQQHLLSQQGQIGPSASSLPESSNPPASDSIYVAMGDSYSAGGGADRTPSNLKIDVSAYDTTTKCWRSKNAAQYLLTKQFDYTLIDASCGGAVVENLTITKQEDMPPQVTKLTPNTKLVTMTVGGNDTALLYALNCIQTSDCSNNVVMTTLIDLRIAGLAASLEKLYADIGKKAPDAKIRHAGYPHILAAPGNPTSTCAEWLTDSEARVFDRLLVRTNDAIKTAVQKYAASSGKDAKYVDPLATNSPFMQRDGTRSLDGCSESAKRYMNGPNDGKEGGWHPNIYGQQHYYELYKASL